LEKVQSPNHLVPSFITFENSKVVPVHAMKAHRGDGDITPLILNPSTTGSWSGIFGEEILTPARI
jgi:hypothetical protein